MTYAADRHKSRIGEQRKAAEKALRDAVAVAKHCRDTKDKADMWDRLIAASERIFDKPQKHA